ncbi:AraC family transcriptional regulator [Leifsonia sp. EB34]|uniref:AraC family transcriptional regulator n=1 Tax=Leifsonia sp. EB34 TaxID=3156303 RepID=UPI003512AB12
MGEPSFPVHTEANEMFGGRRIPCQPDVDEVRRVLSDVFLPLDFPSVRSTSTIDMTLNALTGGTTTCAFVRFQDAVRIDTVEAANFIVNIPTAGRATMRAAFQAPVFGTPRTAAVFTPGRPLELHFGGNFSQIALMIPKGQLQLELEHLLGARARRPLEFEAELNIDSPGGKSILHTAHIIDSAASQAAGPLTHPLAVQQLERSLIQALLFAQPHNYTAALAAPAPAAGTRPLVKAVELLRSDPAHPWTVAELAAEVSVSVRSLQEEFRRSLDTTPTTYLRRLRLEEVQRELSAAEPGTVRVTDVAMRWGFVHLGRFAAEYSRAFGERPSTTLRR